MGGVESGVQGTLLVEFNIPVAAAGVNNGKILCSIQLQKHLVNGWCTVVGLLNSLI
jgi:hypothetical protein